MKSKVIFAFIIYLSFVSQIPVLAANVSTWAELDAQVTAGDSSINLLNDITNTPGGLSITNTASTTSIDGTNLPVNYSISADGSNARIFYNTGTLSISNTSLTNGFDGIKGGAIYNTGTLNLTNVNFTSSFALSGGAIYNDGGTVFINANGDNVNFSNNANSGKDIFMNGGSLTLNANAGNSITFVGGIGGTAGSSIIKNGDGSLRLTPTEDSSGFLGTFTQNAGSTSVQGISQFNTAKFFGGTSIINAGTLNFNAGGELVNGSSITLNNNAVMNVNDNADIGPLTGTGNASITINNSAALYLLNSNDISFKAYISGERGGNVYQTGSGTTRYQLDYNNFLGTFTQTAGSSTFGREFGSSVGGGFFGGDSYIKNASSVDFNNGTHLYNGSNIYLTDSASLNITGKGSVSVTMDTGSNIDLGGVNTTFNIGTLGSNLDLNTKLTGNGTINNNSNNTINLTADNAGFTGAFNQSSGITNVSNKFFSGTSTINDGTLNLNNGGSLGLTSFIQLNDTVSNTQMNVNDGSSMATGASIGVGANTTLNFNNTSTYDLNASVSGTGTINKNNGGTLNVNQSITGGPTINLNAGTLALSNDSYINNSNLGIYGGAINTQNGLIGTIALNNLTFGGNANWLMDVDLANKLGDKITSTNPATGAGSLNISTIKLLSYSNSPSVAVTVADNNTKGYLTTSVTSASTPLYQYNVSYNSTNGTLNFINSGFTPSALTNPVSATVGTFLNQTNVYAEALTRAEEFMSLPLAERERPKLAYIGVFSPTLLPEYNRGLWIKQFTTFENVPLNNGPNVSNVSYFTLVGGDTDLTHLKHGYDGYLTAYLGYIGSHQNYSNVGTNQNGALVGLTGTVYKKNFFATMTANIGDNAGNANTIYGTDSFNILTASTAAKVGYNVEFLEGKIIFQPSYAMGYVFANTFPYTTASGLSITSNPLNAIQIIPGVKLIGNLKKGWQPYLSASMVWNIMDNQKFYANDVPLPQMSVAPYVMYGFGVQRKWRERFNTFIQVLALGGGRNGVELQFGFRWAF